MKIIHINHSHKIIPFKDIKNIYFLKWKLNRKKKILISPS